MIARITDLVRREGRDVYDAVRRGSVVEISKMSWNAIESNFLKCEG